MLDTETFTFDPVLTPGFAHADNLTEEGARAVEECLRENNEKYHIFFTTEAHMGVSATAYLIAHKHGLKFDASRCTCTTTLPITIPHYGPWAPRPKCSSLNIIETPYTCEIP